MKKIVLLSLAAVALAAPAFAYDDKAATPATGAGMTADATKDALKTVKLKDGSTVKVTKDNVVLAADKDGKWAPVPAGSWTAADGSTIKTDEKGKITENN